MTEERTYCIVPDCDEQPYPGNEMCDTHLAEDTARERRGACIALGARVARSLARTHHRRAWCGCCIGSVVSSRNTGERSDGFDSRSGYFA